MTDSSSPDPLKKLVGWIIVLAIAATAVAFLVYFFIILPAKTGQAPPLNEWINGTCIPHEVGECGGE
jgi:hypothetical protein